MARKKDQHIVLAHEESESDCVKDELMGWVSKKKSKKPKKWRKIKKKSRSSLVPAGQIDPADSSEGEEVADAILHSSIWIYLTELFIS